MTLFPGCGTDFLIVYPQPWHGRGVWQRGRSRQPRGEAPSGKARLRWRQLELMALVTH